MRHPAGEARNRHGRHLEWFESTEGRHGQLVTPGAPRDENNTALHTVGATHGVIKNVADAPHGSDNGH